MISSFACFLTAIAKVQFLEGRLGTRLCLHVNLSSPNISLNFLILKLRCFVICLFLGRKMIISVLLAFGFVLFARSQWHNKRSWFTWLLIFFSEVSVNSVQSLVVHHEILFLKMIHFLWSKYIAFFHRETT